MSKKKKLNKKQVERARAEANKARMEAGESKTDGLVAQPHGQVARATRPDEDEGLIEQCIKVVRSENAGSVSLLQRRLRLGYTRAARIMDELERRGVVGPAKEAEMREVFAEKSEIGNRKSETDKQEYSTFNIQRSTSNGEEQTYPERARRMDEHAMVERLVADSARCGVFRLQMGQVESHLVSSAEVARELGLSFQEYFLPAGEEAAENYFNSHYKKQLGIEFEQFKWLIQAAKRLPERIASAADVFPAFKQLSLAGELESLPERGEPQSAHVVAPLQFWFERLAKARAALEPQLAHAQEWDEETREGIRAQIDSQIKFLTEARTKL